MYPYHIVGSCWFCILPTSHGGLSAIPEAMRTGPWSLQTATELEILLVTSEGGRFHCLLSGLMDSYGRSFRALFQFILHWLIRLPYLILPIVVSVSFQLSVMLIFIWNILLKFWESVDFLKSHIHPDSQKGQPRGPARAPCRWPSIAGDAVLRCLKGGYPSYHPFIDGIFHYKLSSYWGTPVLGNLQMADHKKRMKPSMSRELSSVWQSCHQFLPSCKLVHNTHILLSIWRWINKPI